MNKERDFLPWVLGGLSVAAVALAFTAVLTHRTAASNLSPASLVASEPLSSSALPLAAAAPPVPASPLASTALNVPMPEPAPIPSPTQSQVAAEPEVPTGQIWECMTKGVKTFSNNPCGEKSTLLDVGPVNTMNPTPAIHYARGYVTEPRNTTAYADRSAPADADEYSDQYSSESGGNSYTIIQGVGFVPRRRPEHPHRPANHHNPAPMRRN